MGVKKGQYRVCDLVLFSLAEGLDNAAEDNFPLKQEGGGAPLAQGEGAGKYLLGDMLLVYCYGLELILNEFTPL